MPNGDKTGPNGDGPKTGKGEKGKGQGTGRGRKRKVTLQKNPLKFKWVFNFYIVLNSSNTGKPHGLSS